MLLATVLSGRPRVCGAVLALGVCLLGTVACTPGGRKAKVDLNTVGGASFTFHLVPRTADTGEAMPITPAQMDQAVEMIEKRLNSIGTAEFALARQGDHGILLEIPGIKPEETTRIRTTTGLNTPRLPQRSRPRLPRRRMTPARKRCPKRCAAASPSSR